MQELLPDFPYFQAIQNNFINQDQTPSEVTSVYSISQSHHMSIQAPLPPPLTNISIPTQIPLDPIQRIKNKNRSITPDVVQIPTLINSIEQVQNLNYLSSHNIHQMNGQIAQQQYVAFPQGIITNSQYIDQKNNVIYSNNHQPNQLNGKSGINTAANYTVSKSNNHQSPRSFSVGVTPIVHKRVISATSINSLDNTQQKANPYYQQNQIQFSSNNHNNPNYNNQIPSMNNTLNASIMTANIPSAQNYFSQQSQPQNGVQGPIIATALTLSGQMNDRNQTPPSKINFSKQPSTGTTDLYQSHDYRSNSLNQARSQLLNIKISQYGKVMNARDEKDIPQNPLKKIIQKPLLNKTSSGIFDSQNAASQAVTTPSKNVLPPMIPVAPGSVKNNMVISRVNNHLPLTQQSQNQSLVMQNSQSVSPLKRTFNGSLERDRTDSPEKLLSTIKPYISITNSAEFKPVQKVIINIPPNNPMNLHYQQNQQNLSQVFNDVPNQSTTVLQPIQATQPLQQQQQQQLSQKKPVTPQLSAVPFTNSGIVYAAPRASSENPIKIINNITQSSPAAAQLNIHQLNSTPQTLFTSTNQRVPSLNSFNCFQSSQQLIENIPAESKYNNSEQEESNSSKINAIIKPSQITKKEHLDQLLQSNNESPSSEKKNLMQTPIQKESTENRAFLDQYQSAQTQIVTSFNNTSIPSYANYFQSQENNGVKTQITLSPNKQEIMPSSVSSSSYKNAQIQLRNTVDQLKNIIKLPNQNNNNITNANQPNEKDKNQFQSEQALDKTQQYQKRLLTINTQIEEIKRKNEDSTKNIGITINDLIKNEMLIEQQLAEYKEHQNLVGQKLIELDERIQKQTYENNSYLQNSPNSQQKMDSTYSDIQQQQQSPQNQGQQLDNIIEERSENNSESETVKRSHKFALQRESPNNNNNNNFTSQEEQSQNNNNNNSFGQINLNPSNNQIEKLRQNNEQEGFNLQDQRQSPKELNNPLSNQMQFVPETTSYLIQNDAIENKLTQSYKEKQDLLRSQQSEDNIVKQLTLGGRSSSQTEEQLLRQSTHQNANSVTLQTILRKQNSSNSNSPTKTNDGLSPLRRINNDLRKSISELQGKKVSSPSKAKQNRFNTDNNNDASLDANQKSSLLLFKTDNDTSSQLFSQALSENVDNIQQYRLNQSGNFNNKSNNSNSQLKSIPENKQIQNDATGQPQQQQSNTFKRTTNIANKNSKQSSQNPQNGAPVESSRDFIISHFQYLMGLANKQLSPKSKAILEQQNNQQQNGKLDKSIQEKSPEKSMNSQVLQNSSQSSANDLSLTSSQLKKLTKSSHLTVKQQQSNPKATASHSNKKQPSLKKDLKIETDLEKIKSVITKSQVKPNTTASKQKEQKERSTTPNSKLDLQQNQIIEEQGIQQVQRQPTQAKTNTPKFSESKTFSIQSQQEQQSNKSDAFSQQIGHQEDSMIIPINLKDKLQNQESNYKSSSKRSSQELKNHQQQFINQQQQQQQQHQQESNSSLNGMTFNGQQLLEKIQNHLGINQNNQNNSNTASIRSSQVSQSQSQQNQKQKQYNQQNQEQIAANMEDYETLHQNQYDDADQFEEVRLNNYYSQPPININQSNNFNQTQNIPQNMNTDGIKDDYHEGNQNDEDEENLLAALNDLNQKLKQKSTKSNNQLGSSQHFVSKTPERSVTEANEDSHWQMSYSQNKPSTQKNKLNKSTSQDLKKSTSNSQSPMKGSYKQQQQHQQQLQLQLQQSMTESKKVNKNSQSPNQQMVQHELKRIYDVYQQNSKNENSKTLQEMQQIMFKTAKNQNYESSQSPVKQPQYIQKKGVNGGHKKNNSMTMSIKQLSYKEEPLPKQQSFVEMNMSSSNNNTNINGGAGSGIEDSQAPKTKKTYSGMHFKKQVYTIVKDVDDQQQQQTLQSSQLQKKISSESKEQNNNIDALMKERSFEYWAEKIKNSDNPKQILDVWKMINSANKTKQ